MIRILDALTASENEILEVLREAAGVVNTPEPEDHRTWTAYNAGMVMGPSGGRRYDQKMERLEAVYDKHATELQAIPRVTDPAQWTEIQQRMLR